MSDRRPGSNATHPWRTRRAVGLRAGVDGQETNKARAVDLDLANTGPDPWGGPRAAFRATVELPREDFAMNYNQDIQAGMATIGTTLRVGIDLQAVHGPSELWARSLGG
ncbi:hypothetical protein ABIA33_007591 [Streptacidiphilus sp. MAP12-16]